MKTAEYISISKKAIDVDRLNFAQSIPFHPQKMKQQLTEQEKDCLHSFLENKLQKAASYTLTSREYITNKAEAWTKRHSYTVYLTEHSHIVLITEDDRNNKSRKSYPVTIKPRPEPEPESLYWKSCQGCKYFSNEGLEHDPHYVCFHPEAVKDLSVDGNDTPEALAAYETFCRDHLQYDEIMHSCLLRRREATAAF